MKRALLGILAAAAVSAFVAGCGTGSSVTIARRKIPEYPSAVLPAPEGAQVAVYPHPFSGDAETRFMRDNGHALLVEGLKSAGYGIVPPERSRAGRGPVCVVELAECRHDMPERDDGDMVSVVTVVAVRVRKPGALRHGRVDCGRVRSFQGVCRMALGPRPFDFQMTEEERLKGIRGAVGNLIRSAQFREAVAGSAGS